MSYTVIGSTIHSSDGKDPIEVAGGHQAAIAEAERLAKQKLAPSKPAKIAASSKNEEK